MSHLLHWHKIGDEPSVCVQPPACCRDKFATVLAAKLAEADRAHDDAVHTERRRVILDAVAATTTYGEAVASVLDPERAELINTVIARILEAIKRTGCICPRVEVTTLGDVGPVYMRGGDNRCGMHEVSPCHE